MATFTLHRRGGIGCSLASVTEDIFLPGLGWSVEREESLRLKKPAVGSHPTSTRSVTVNYFHGLWKLDRILDRLINKKPEGLAVVTRIPWGWGYMEKWVRYFLFLRNPPD